MKSGTITVALGGDVRGSLCQFCDQTECGISKEKACVQACTMFMERVLENEVRYTIHEWEVRKNVIIMDPDGFNRKDPDLMKRRFTEQEFDAALPLCTAMISSPGSKTRFWNNELISLGSEMQKVQRLKTHKEALEEELFSTKMAIDETTEDINNLTAQLDDAPISTISQTDAKIISDRLAEVAKGSADKCSMHNVPCDCKKICAKEITKDPQWECPQGLDKFEKEHLGCNGCRNRSGCLSAKHNVRCGQYAYVSCEDDL